MTRARPTPLAILLLSLAACAEPGTYPITGAECGPDDPVKSVETMGCAPGVVAGL